MPFFVTKKSAIGFAPILTKSLLKCSVLNLQLTHHAHPAIYLTPELVTSVSRKFVCVGFEPTYYITVISALRSL